MPSSRAPGRVPTYTRMFTFRQHVDSLLLLTLLEGVKLRERMLRLVTLQPRQDNARRLRMVTRWLRRDDARQYLRRASLCLRITGVAHAMAARTADTGKAPMVVRLARGEVQAALDGEVRRSFPKVWGTPWVPFGGVGFSLPWGFRLLSGPLSPVVRRSLHPLGPAR